MSWSVLWTPREFATAGLGHSDNLLGKADAGEKIYGRTNGKRETQRKWWG